MRRLKARVLACQRLEKEKQRDGARERKRGGSERRVAGGGAEDNEGQEAPGTSAIAMVDSAPVLAPVHHLDISPRPPPTPDNDTPPIGRLLLVSEPASWEVQPMGEHHYTLFPPKANKIPVIIHRPLSTLHLSRGQLPAEWG